MTGVKGTFVIWTCTVLASLAPPQRNALLTCLAGVCVCLSVCVCVKKTLPLCVFLLLLLRKWTVHTPRKMMDAGFLCLDKDGDTTICVIVEICGFSSSAAPVYQHMCVMMSYQPDTGYWPLLVSVALSCIPYVIIKCFVLSMLYHNCLLFTLSCLSCCVNRLASLLCATIRRGSEGLE